MDELNERLASILVVGASFYGVVLSPLNLWLAPPGLVGVSVATGLFVGALALGIGVRRFILKRPIAGPTVVLVSVAQAVLCVMVRESLEQAPAGAPLWIYPVIGGGISFILLVMTPTQRRPVWLLQVKLAAIFLVYALVSAKVDRATVVLLGMTPGLAAILKEVQGRFLRRIAELEARLSEAEDRLRRA